MIPSRLSIAPYDPSKNPFAGWPITKGFNSLTPTPTSPLFGKLTGVCTLPPTMTEEEIIRRKMKVENEHRRGLAAVTSPLFVPLPSGIKHEACLSKSSFVRTELAWDRKEENDLLNYLDSGMTYAQIADKIERTEESIVSKLLRMSVQMFRSGDFKIDELVEFTKLSKEAIQAAINQPQGYADSDAEEDDVRQRDGDDDDGGDDEI